MTGIAVMNEGRHSLIPVLVASLILASFATPILAAVPVNALSVEHQDSNATQDQLWALGEPIGLFGPLKYDNGTAEGAFVQFTFNDSESSILNYKVNNGTSNATIFSQIQFTGLDLNPNIRTIGPLFQMIGNTTAVFIHNNPTGLMQVVSMNQGDSVRMVLADGMNLVEEKPNGTTVANITGNGMNGTLLVYNGTISQVPGNSSEPTVLLVTFDPNGAMQFRCIPKSGSAGEQQEQEIQSAFARAVLGGEAWVTINGSNYIYEDASINGITPHVESTSTGELRIQLNLTSTDNKGKLVLIEMDQKIIDPKSNATVTLDNQTVSRASNLASVLNATNGTDNKSSYFAMGAGNLTKYVIFIPTFNETSSLVINTSSSSGSAASVGGAPLVVTLLMIGAILAGSYFAGAPQLDRSRKRP